MCIVVYDLFFLLFEIIAWHSIWALFSVVSIGLQGTTIYIIYKLREKILSGEDPNAPLVPLQTHVEATNAGTTNPVMANATYVSPVYGETSNNSNNNNNKNPTAPPLALAVEYQNSKV
jgi:hypothetical protein